MRFAALLDGLIASIDEWRAVYLDTNTDAGVFPTEKLTTPLAKDNCWRRSLLARLKPIGLDQANFQLMRRTHSSLLKELDVDLPIESGKRADLIVVEGNPIDTFADLRKVTCVVTKGRVYDPGELWKSVGFAPAF